MPDIASEITIKSAPIDIDAVADLDVSPYFVHSSKLQQHREYANSLLDDITSAIIYKGKNCLVYVLLKHAAKFQWLVYNIDTKKHIAFSDIQLLDLIQCSEQTERAFVNPQRIEICSNEAIESWCDANQVNHNDIVRFCTLYLQPQGQSNEVDNIFSSTKNLSQSEELEIG